MLQDLRWANITSQAFQRITEAEEQLGHLSDGQRRDLLMDNLLVSWDEARILVNAYAGYEAD